MLQVPGKTWNSNAFVSDDRSLLGGGNRGFWDHVLLLAGDFPVLNQHLSPPQCTSR
jgi:hypothetical protein